jgi:hypothetical protein
VADERPDRVSVPTLVVTGGALDGTSYELPPEGECVIGSNMEADVQILLGNVEAYHARITVEPTGLTIADVGSSTGTFVNGEKVEGEHPLQQGDRICLGPPGAKGSAKMLVFIPSPGDTIAAPPLDFGAELGQTAAAELETSSANEVDIVDVSPADEGDDLFSAPLPPSVEAAPAAPAQPVYAAPPPPPPRARAEAAPPAPTAPPAPPPPVAPRVERLTAPAPPEAPPPPPRSAAREPEYQSDLPSIPVPAAERSEPAESSGHHEAAARPFPSLRSLRKAPAGKGRAPRRRRALALPSVPLPLVGGVLGLAAIGGLAWLFLFRASAPQLRSIAPVQAEAGQSVTLTGTGFAADAAGNTVLFGALRGNVTSASKTEIQALVPDGVAAQVPVVVETKGGRSAAVMLTVAAAATATALQPEVAMPGQTVLIRGQGFAGQSVTVEMGGLPATSVEASADGVRAVVPALGLPEGSSTPVVVSIPGKPARTFDLLVGRLPLVMKVEPASAVAGDRVVLQGRGFAPDAATNAVTIGGQAALVLKAAGSSLTVVVPAAPATDVQPDMPVVVRANGRTSSTNVSLRIARSGSSTFVPRFYAAPVVEYAADGLAFVSTALGPVLVLGGAAEAPSTAERAAALADQLNALVAGASSKPLAFEARESPQPSVAVVGEASPLVAPTAEDVAAYSRSWESARGAGRRVTASALARHWAAVLHDYIGLFLYRQRPLKLLALSPRGKVLNDLYGEAVRRAPGGTGVPAGLVFPTTTTLANDLRAMALVVSTEGGRAAVAVEGRWVGTIQDPDLGDRPFSVQIRSEAGRLAGTITTSAGGIDLQAPLRELGFDRGSVRFTADLQGAAYRFKGTLDGNAVNGTIDRPGRPPAKFALQFAE